MSNLSCHSWARAKRRNDWASLEYAYAIAYLLVDHCQRGYGSLLKMRQTMLAGPFGAGIFIGGMEGVEEEYAMFRERHPTTVALPIASTGAAAARLFNADLELQRNHPELRDEISYLTLIRGLLMT